MYKKFVCVTEDAYKALVSPETKGKFLEKSFTQVFMSDEQIASKLKTYTMNEEDKNFRIIKPLFNESGHSVTGVAVLTSIDNGSVVWNR